MEAAFCIEAVEEVLARYGKPDIFNTDSQKIIASSWAV
jgi:putative transposase